MSATVIVQPGNRSFTVEGNDTILESGLSAGVALEHGCANGSCGLCKARIVSGTTETTRFFDFVLREREKRDGYVLLCATTAVSDVVVEARVAGTPDDIAHQDINAKLGKVERLGSLHVLNVRAPRSRLLRFLAGQHVRVDLGEGICLDMSLANCPCDGLNLQFHLPDSRLETTLSSLLSRAKKGDPVRIRGPSGRFVLDEQSTRPAVFIAHGTAFAPIKSLIEHAVNLEYAAPLRLFWHAPGEGEPYAHNLCRSWSDALDDFNYQWSCAARDWCLDLDDWLGAKSRCDQECDTYLSGPGWFVEAARDVLAKHGLDARLRVSDLEVGL